MNIISFEQAKNTKATSKSGDQFQQGASNKACQHHFIEKFEEILATFRDQEDHHAFDDLTHFLQGLDDHLDEMTRLKESACFLEKMMLQAKDLAK
jgi:hypothetical protein